MINGAFCAVFHNLTLTHCQAHALLVLFLKLYFWRASPTSGVIFYVQEASIFWLHLFFLVANLELCTKFYLMKIRMYFFFGCLPAINGKNDSHLSQFIFRKRKKYFTLFFRRRAKNDDSVFLLPATNRLVLWQHLTKSMGSGCAFS